MLGVKRGCAEPSTSPTGLEKVRYSFVAGPMRAPAAGNATITVEWEGGNQLTCVGGPTLSHDRGAVATSTVPVFGWRPSEIELCPV